jgi:hypothetical protein
MHLQTSRQASASTAIQRRKNMELSELVADLRIADYAGILLIVLTLIQITPIKINPWTLIARAIGKALNEELKEEINKDKADDKRYRILRFDDEIRHRIKHTEEHFNQIIEDIDRYEDYCSNHKNYENNKATMAIQNIKQAYSKCKTENTFLI